MRLLALSLTIGLAAFAAFAQTSEEKPASISWHEIPLTDEMAIAVWGKKIPKGMNVAAAADLNEDGVDELLFQPNPRHPKASSYSKNVFVMIYGQGKGFHKLLKAQMPATLQPEILSSSTNGYHDIRTAQSISAGESYITLYAFTGEKYALQECWKRTRWPDGREENMPMQCE